MGLSLKLGTKVEVPIPAGWTVSADKPNIIGVSQNGQRLTLTALGLGSAWLTVAYGGDLKASLLVTVTAN